MHQRFYSIISIFIVNLIMFNWSNQHSFFSLIVIMWSLLPLYCLHLAISHYEYSQQKKLINIQSHSAWVLYFAWLACLFFAIALPCGLNFSEFNNPHYASFYIISPAISLFLASISAVIASLLSKVFK